MKRLRYSSECAMALTEIDRLRRWKDEALPLLELLDRCHGLLPPDDRACLGDSKAEAVEKFLYTRLFPSSPENVEEAT